LTEIPFDADRKMMTTLIQGTEAAAFSKGAMENFAVVQSHHDQR
jgi:magnesium-transporting ATPase (P-type)